MQETHLYDMITKQQWMCQLRDRYRTFFSLGSRGSKGTGILIGVDVPFKLMLEHEDVGGRYTILKGTLFGELVTLASIYAPNDRRTRREFFADLVKLGLRGMLYLMGDYNAVVSNTLDRLNGKGGGDNELIDFMNVTDVVDPWRKLNGEDQLFSWERSSDNVQVASRLDMITVSRVVMKNVLDIQYYNSGGFSDHSFVWMKIDCGENSMGRDLFCIKPFVYKETEFIEGLEDLLEKESGILYQKLCNILSSGNFRGSSHVLRHEIENGADITRGLLLSNLNLDGSWWEGFKNKVRNIAIKTQKNCRVRDAFEYGNLQREFSWAKGAGNKKRARDKIASKLREMSAKDIFEARIDDLKYNEKCNSTFLRRVSEKGRKQFLDCLEIGEDQFLKDRVDIILEPICTLTSLNKSNKRKQ